MLLEMAQLDEWQQQRMQLRRGLMQQWPIPQRLVVPHVLQVQLPRRPVPQRRLLGHHQRLRVQHVLQSQLPRRPVQERLVLRDQQRLRVQHVLQG